MPIAHCYLSPQCPKGQGDLISLWAHHSDVKPHQMTVNLICCQQQSGQQYSVIANLTLPSLWSSAEINNLQYGLSKALACYFQLQLEDVLVITTIVESGHVVENGEQINW